MSEREIKVLVQEDDDGERLDRLLAETLPQYSREQLKSLILKGNVAVNERTVVKPAFHVTQGEELKLEIPELKPLQLAAEAIPLEILYEDPELLVLNKPSGMLTHPTGKERHGTLVNALLAHCSGQLSGINGIERPGIVHRLDRDTSGLMVVAKSDSAHRNLQKQIQERSAKRCYRAIVQGIMPASSGTVNAPIGRNPKNREKMAVILDVGVGFKPTPTVQAGNKIVYTGRASAREAVTDWKVIATIGDRFSLLECSLRTGRTHQIRVHMAYLGHPIFGDPLYGTGLEKIMKYNPNGQVLQSFRLSFKHPMSEENLVFEIPPDRKFLDTKTFLLMT